MMTARELALLGAALGPIAACGSDDTTAADASDEATTDGGTDGAAPGPTSGGANASGGDHVDGSGDHGSGSGDRPDTDTGSTGDASPLCGDGHLDPGEECDDGDDDAFDGCRPDCTAVASIDPPELDWTWYEIEGTTSRTAAATSMRATPRR
jgi:cysteine-rich repeat protein